MCDNRYQDRSKSRTSAPRRYMANLRKPMPPDQKVKMVARNVWIRLAKRQMCCGHPGQPGC